MTIEDYTWLDEIDPDRSEPRILRILLKLKAIVEHTPGFEGANIMIGRGHVPESGDDPPIVAIHEIPVAEIEGSRAQFDTMRGVDSLDIMIEGFAIDGIENAYRLKAALEQTLAAISPPSGTVSPHGPIVNLGGDVHDFGIARGGVDMLDDNGTPTRRSRFLLPLAMSMAIDQSKLENRR